MKTKILLLYSIICSLPLIAQNYVPFPADSARWKISYGMSIMGCTGFAGEAQYEITGDTVMGNQTYHKIYQISYSASPNCFATGSNGFTCGIREDSSKRVWLRYDASQGEELLYDFNLNVGDTVNTIQNCGCDATVTLIDSVLIGTSYRKQYHVSRNFFCGGGTITIIEGIGSTTNLLQCFGWLEQTSSVTCFWHNGQTLYPYSSSNCTPLVQNISDNNTPDDLIVYPNPAANEVTITSTRGFNSSVLMTVTDINGRIVRSEMTQPINGTLYLQRGELNSGLYFVEFRNNYDEVARTKVLFR